MKLKLKIICGMLTALIASVSIADEAKDKAFESLTAILNENLTLESFEATEVEDVYEATIDGGIYHVYAIGGYVLVGEAFKVETGESLRDQKLAVILGELIDNTSQDNMIVFLATDRKRTLTVFTDIDCVYCRRFHRAVPDLNEVGVEVRYFAFPRAGVPSSSYDKYVDVWCSDDQQQAMTYSKGGLEIPPQDCDNPVAAQYYAALHAGVRATPIIFVDDGSVIQGYVPLEEMLEKLGLL